MRTYRGDRPCPGCGTPGNERSRPRADELCRECQKALEIGKSIKQNEEVYGIICLDPHNAGQVILTGDDTTYGHDIPYVSCLKNDDYNSKTLQQALKNFIATLGIGKRSSDKRMVTVANKSRSPDCHWVGLSQAKMFFRLWDQVCGFTSFIKYKSFVEGTDLLKGLNSGRITLDDFEERVDNAKAKIQ